MRGIPRALVMITKAMQLFFLNLLLQQTKTPLDSIVSKRRDQRSQEDQWYCNKNVLVLVHRMIQCIININTIVASVIIIIGATDSIPSLYGFSPPNNNNNYKYKYSYNMMASTKAAAAKTAIASSRRIGQLQSETTIVLVCDMQERFRPLLYKSDTIVNTCRYLTSVAQVLAIPMVATQQYTKVFGPTIQECLPLVPSPSPSSSSPVDDDKQQGTIPTIPTTMKIFEKKQFSMLTDEVQSHLHALTQQQQQRDTNSNKNRKTSYLIVGCEAHVCVQQTCLELLEQQQDVHVIVDGVSSQQSHDREIALQRLQQAGAYLTTAYVLSNIFMSVSIKNRQ